MSNEICSICLENIQDKNISKGKYNCNHSFHNVCVSNWKGDCPLCRASKLKELIYINERIEGFKNIQNCIPSSYINIYMNKWSNRYCLENNHSIFFRKPFGVIGVCETCNTIECFNLSH